MKLNVQFASGNTSYIYGNDGGAERVHALVEDISRYNFAPIAQGFPSDYCTYCPIRESCKQEVVIR